MRTASTALTLLYVLIATACAESIVLVREGKSEARIVVAKDAPSTVKYASRELQHYINKMSGAQLPITNEPAEKTLNIHVGRSAYTEKMGVSVKGIGPDGFRIVSGKNDVALVGRDYTGNLKTKNMAPTKRKFFYNDELQTGKFGESGTLFAVYHLLYNQGVRWYAPGDIGEVVPNKKTIVIAPGNLESQPNYKYRHLYYCKFPYSKSNARWFKRIGAGGADFVYVNHSMQRSLPKYVKTHPEMFAMRDGKRKLTRSGSHGYMPCLQSEGFFKETVKRTRAFFDKKPHERVCAVMPPDGYSGCDGPKCAPLMTPERGKAGKHSDYVWDFVNRVAIEIKKTHPDKMISNCAYARYLLPPLKIERMSDNIIIMMCQKRALMFDRGYRAMVVKARRDWKKKLPGGEFYTWEYYNFNLYHKLHGLPVIFTKLLAEDMQSLRNFSSGQFTETNKGSNQSLASVYLNNLMIYLDARMEWNPDIDVNAEVREYCDLFYGPASNEMKRFFEECENIWMRPVSPKLRYKGGIKNLVKVQDVKRLFAILADAQKKATSDPYRKRIELLIRDCGPLKTLYGPPPKGLPAAIISSVPVESVKIDGKLDEPFWKKQTIYTMVDNKTGKKAFEPTHVRIVRTNNDYIFAMECETADISTVPMAARGHDNQNLWKDDAVEIFIATPVNDCYQFAVNPKGALCDLNWEGAESGKQAFAWNSGARVAATTAKNRWIIELAIPRKALDKKKGLRPTPQRPWRLGLFRTHIKPDGGMRFSAWTPTKGKTYRDSQKFGLMILK